MWALLAILLTITPDSEQFQAQTTIIRSFSSEIACRQALDTLEKGAAVAVGDKGHTLLCVRAGKKRGA